MSHSFSPDTHQRLKRASLAVNMVFSAPRWDHSNTAPIPRNWDAEAHGLLVRAYNYPDGWEDHELRLLHAALTIMVNQLDGQRHPSHWSGIDDPAMVETLVEARREAYEDVVVALVAVDEMLTATAMRETDAPQN